MNPAFGRVNITPYLEERERIFFTPVEALVKGEPISLGEAKTLALELHYCFGMEMNLFVTISRELILHGNTLFDSLLASGFDSRHVGDWIKSYDEEGHERVNQALTKLVYSSAN